MHDKSSGLRDWRTVAKEQRWTYAALAKEIGAKPRTVYSYSTGQHPASAWFLERVSALFGETVR